MINASNVIILFAAIILCGCNNGRQNNAKDVANGIENSVTAHTPGTVPASNDGFYLKATINGKDWAATDVMPPEKAGRIIGYNGKEYIGLPYDRRDMVVGHKIQFKNEAVDISLNDDVGIWGGHTGEMEITKADEKFAEGTFFLTADGLQTDKKLQLTNGRFRILFSDQ